MATITPLRLLSIFARQIGSETGGGTTTTTTTTDDDPGWWWSTAGIAVRYTIVLVLILAFLLFFVGGHLHAQRRVRQGLPPLRYHRWMARRTYYPRNTTMPYNPYNANMNNGYNGGMGGVPPPRPEPYDMPGYPPPPPAYGQGEAPPPVYQPPPAGGTKAMADQHVHVREVEEGGASSSRE